MGQLQPRSSVNSGALAASQLDQNYVYPTITRIRPNTAIRSLRSARPGVRRSDEAKREQLYKQVQAIVHEELPYLPIFNMELFIGGQAGTGGILFFANNNHDYILAYRIID